MFRHNEEPPLNARGIWSTYKQEGLVKRRDVCPGTVFFHCLTLAAAFFLLWETAASAYETRVVTDHANTPLFQLRFFDQGEEYGNALSETEGEVSTWQLSAAQKDAVTQAVELWADILGPGANNAVPAAINVGTMNEVNADAISVANPTWHGTPWEGSSGWRAHSSAIKA